MEYLRRHVISQEAWLSETIINLDVFSSAVQVLPYTLIFRHLAFLVI